MRPTLNDLEAWALAALGEIPPARTFETLSGDASARRYYRITTAGGSYIVVDTPPATEKNREFVLVQAALAAAGIRVPGILGVNLERGLMLLDDLGDSLLLAQLHPGNVDGYYREAFGILRKLASAGSPGKPWPRYDRALLAEELSRFGHWFVGELLGAAAPPAPWRELESVLIESALAQPTTLVHRDFHSRNLMLPGDGGLAVIDFQDAVIGPVTYDLVSLLRDCYTHWPVPRVRAWALQYLALAQAGGELEGVAEAQFMRWFDLMGLQRHIKVLGTFARLFLRDQKPAYLEDLPLVVSYVRQILGHYRQERAFAGAEDWFEGEIMPLVRASAWGGAL